MNAKGLPCRAVLQIICRTNKRKVFKTKKKRHLAPLSAIHTYLQLDVILME